MKKKKLLIPVVASLVTVLVLSGVSYAYFSAKIKENNKTETVIKSNELNLIFTGTNEITANNMIPGDSFTKTFTVENTSNRAVDFNVYMQNITNEFNEDLVYTLSDEEGVVVSETALPVTNTEKSYLKTALTIDAGVTKNYTLKIEYKYLDTPQNDYQGKTFKATVGIDTERVGETYSLYGTVYKKENDTEVLVTEGNLVFFSEHQDIAITSEGKFEATNLEVGNHEVYYMGNIDASSMTKEEVQAQSKCSATFKMATSDNKITLTCKNPDDDYSLNDIKIIKIEQGNAISMYDKIKSLSLGDSSQIDFNVTSEYAENNGTFTSGVYQFKDEPSVYFYRGNVNNNLILGNYCWKIIRTSKSEGVKLLYNGEAIDGQCFYQLGENVLIGKTTYAYNEIGNDSKYLGYTYDNNGEEKDSTIKEKIDNWYSENFISNESYLEDVGFCNDKRTLSDHNLINGWENVTLSNLYAASGRSFDSAKNINPTLSCAKEDLYTLSSDKGNGKLKYPIGLLTTDEIIFAGQSTKYQKTSMSDYSTKSYYLYAEKEYWTMTPIMYNNSAEVAIVYNHYPPKETPVTNTMGIRPVISLNKNVYYNGGEGTSRRPYRVTLDKNEASNIVEPEIISCVVDPSYTYSGEPSVGTQVTYSSKVVYTNHYELVDPQQFNVGDDTSTLVGKFFYYGTSTSNSYVYYINSVDETTGAVTSYSAVYNGDCVD